MRIIVATDGSECSQQAIDFIAARPWKDDDYFICLSVVEPIPVEFGIGAVPDTTARYEEGMYEEATKITADDAARIREKLGNTNTEAKVLTGMVAETICRFAKEVDADLIVMGSHGRTGFKHFLLGSVAEEVLKKSPCSVEVIKDKKKSTKALEK